MRRVLVAAVVALSLTLFAGAGCGRRAATPTTKTPPPVEPPAKRTLGLCMPKAAPQQIYSLVSHAGSNNKSCRLERHERLEGKSGALRSAEVHELRSDGVIEVVTILPDGRRRLDQRFERDIEGRIVWHERIRNGTVSSRTERTFDSAGHLLLDRRTTSSVRTIEQAFDSAGRITLRRTTMPNSSSELSWRYDSAGRLVEAIERSGDKQRQRAVWSYDAAGRPASLERYRAGELLTRQSWTWADGARIEDRPKLLSRTSESFGQTYSATLLDNYQTRGQWNYYYGAYVTPWFENLPGWDGSCTPLRTAFGLDDRAEYALVWQRAERDVLQGLRDKNGYPTWDTMLGPGIGYAGYGLPYNYYVAPLPVIYGHLGAGRPWTTVLHSSSTKMVEQFDGRGRMIRQHVETTQHAGDPQRERTMRHERERRFEGDALRFDRVVFAAGEADSVTRTLRFAHDGAGRVTRRELYDGADGSEKLIEWQSWQRDDAGRAVVYRTALQPRMRDVTDPHIGQASELVEPKESGVLERRFDGARLVTESERWTQRGERTSVVRYDGDRVVEVTSTRESGSVTGITSTTVVRQKFDASGRVLEEERTYSGGSHTLSTYRYNAFGLLTRQESLTRSKTSARHDISTYEFSCSAE